MREIRNICWRKLLSTRRFYKSRVRTADGIIINELTKWVDVNTETSKLLEMLVEIMSIESALKYEKSLQKTQAWNTYDMKYKLNYNNLKQELIL